MNGLRLVLFDDDGARAWEPFALTRPVGELRFGVWTLRSRAERVFRAPCIGHLTADHLAGFDEPGAPPVVQPVAVPRDADVVYLSSRAVPRLAAGVEDLLRDAGTGALLNVGGETCGWVRPAGGPEPPPDFWRDPTAATPAGLTAVDLDGRVLRDVWELVTRNAEQVERDVAAGVPAAQVPELPAGVHRIGDGRLVVGRDVVLEPGVVLDLSAGSVWLDDGVHVRAFSRLAGPAYVGQGSMLLGGDYGAVSIGPHCKVHGEVEETVVLSFSNKAHDGFLGHAYVGSWVNLGAFTTNSDLKNNYGSVRIWTPGGMVDTGQTKLGCFIGDHAKTAIGTLLSTGTVIGAGANVFGPDPAPRQLRPFAWGSAGERVYELERFLAAAETVMGRRQVRLSTGQRDLLARAWREATSGR